MQKERKVCHPEKGGSDRRRFLKKAAYAAPTLLVLGQLAKPDVAMGASDTITGPGGTPGGGPLPPV